MTSVVLVKKKDGKVRFCVDYRKLNNVTKKSNYPIPQKDEILTYLHGAKYFTTLDMFSGYWQVPMDEASKQYTAFVAQGHGQYECNVLPFGLTNAPATFQHLADQVFQGIKWKEILIYLDDIIIFSTTLEEHLEKLEKVFQRLRDANLTLKLGKCMFVQTTINILGYTVSETGLTIDESKLVAIKEFPTPKSVKQIQNFVGLCNYYRKFIKNFSLIARPLHLMTKKDQIFSWGEPERKAFEALKQKLLSAPVLQHYDPKKVCELRVDACKTGIGAILLQEGGDKHMHPVSYISRSLSKAERNYSVTELEGLAVIWALGYLRHLVYGKQVTIMTDHHALCWIRSLKDPTGRLARWSLKLSEYDYVIKHKSGSLNKDADCLSRNPVLQATNEDTEESNDVPTFLLQTQDIEKEQQKDTDLVQLKNALLDPTTASIGLSRRAKNFRLIDNILYKINNAEGLQYLLVIPDHWVAEILFSHHNEPTAGHLGIAKITGPNYKKM